MKRDAQQDLTSHIEGGLAVERVVLAEVIHGHGAAAIDGEVHHLVEGDQLNCVEVPVVDGFSTGRKWKRCTHPREWASGKPWLSTSQKPHQPSHCFPRRQIFRKKTDGTKWTLV